MSNSKKILIVVNVDWTFVLHRMEIAKKAIDNGYEVHVAANDSGQSEKITKNGMKFIDLRMSRSGVNPVSELKVFVQMIKIYKKVNPDLIYHVTMKPVIYGTIISKLLNFKTVNTISGLGYNFTNSRKTKVQKVMMRLMKFGFSKDNNHLVFENKDDYLELSELKIVHKKNKVSVLRGVGVDLEKYVPCKKENSKIVVVLPSRMLWDKGVEEFVKAARILRKEYEEKVIFKLFGMIDVGNREAVPQKYLEDNKIEEYLEWYGHNDHMIEIYQNADLVVLPSYREGLPTSLLEACASGLPIITTDTNGCRDCVEEGVNGYMVPVQSVEELALAMKKVFDSKEDRIKMGKHSRLKAEKEFDRNDVVNSYMNIFNNMNS